MIFLVSELYYPEETSTGYILTKIAEGLAETLPIQVVTGPPDYSGVKAAARSEVRNGVRIERVSAINLCKNRIASRLLRSILLSFKLAAKTFKMANKGDTVFVVTNPAPLLVLMCFVCRFTRSSLVILTHDVFPENLQAAQLLKKDSIWFGLLSRIFNSVYRAADHIIVIGRDMEKLIRCKINGKGPEISVITNWADTDDINPAARASNQIIKDLKLESSFIVQFAGNIGRVQGVNQMVDAAEILRGENVHFIFVGDGAKRKWLFEQIELRQLTNITVLDSMPRAEQQLFLNACDVGIVSLSAGMVGLGVPSKVYNILAAGKPVIAVVDPASEVGLLVKEESVGWVVAPADSEKLASAIREASKFAMLDEMGLRARETAEVKYSLHSIIAKYREVLNQYEFRQ